MKAEYSEKPFKPICVILETEEEVSVLRMLLYMKLESYGYFGTPNERNKFLEIRRRMYDILDNLR